MPEIEGFAYIADETMRVVVEEEWLEPRAGRADDLPLRHGVPANAYA